MDANLDQTQAASNGGNSDEYSHQPVPASARKSWFRLLSISLGYVFVVTSMQVGGSIGMGMKFSDAFAAILLSCLILAVLAGIMGVIACKSGLNLGLLSKYSFGMAGTYVPVAIVTITTIGWFSIDAYLIGQTTNTLWPMVPILPIAALGGLGMTLTALRGIKWMNRLANLAVPLIILFGVVSIVVAVKGVGGVSGLMAAQQTADMDFTTAVTLGVGSYAVGAVMFTPDILRFCKSKKASVAIMAVTMLVGNAFVVLFGAIGAVTTGNSDIAFVLAAQGLLAPSFLVLVLNIWSTAQGCVYSGSMSLSATVKVKRPYVVIGFGVIGILFALIGFYNFFGTYIDFLASLVPSLTGIFLADFLFTYRQDYPALDTSRLPMLNAGGFIAWAAGVAVSRIPVGMPVLQAVLAAFIVKALLGNRLGRVEKLEK